MQVYLDINVDREPRGRITVELFPDVPVGAQRFVDLARGVDGVGYSLAAKIDGVSPVMPSEAKATLCTQEAIVAARQLRLYCRH